MDWPILDPSDPTKLLRPQRQQLDFGLSLARNTLAAGGWGSGKTIAGLWFIALSTYLSKPGSVGIVVLPTYPMLKEWLNKMFVPAFRSVIMNHNKQDRCVYLPGGRTIYYKSGHNAEMIQMSNASWGYMDEPHLMDTSVWTHLVARIRKKNDLLRIGLTSLPKMGWLSEYFDGKDNADYRCLHYRTADNPDVSETYVEDLKKNCPARMQDAYLRGLFVPIGGNIYAEFDQNVHVIDFDVIRNENFPVFVAADPSPRKPHLLWIQQIPAGSYWYNQRVENTISIVYDEVFPDGEFISWTIRKLSAVVNLKAKLHGITPKAIITDPAGLQRNLTSDEINDNAILQFRRFTGLPVRIPQPGQSVKLGIQNVQYKLQPLEGYPTIYFSSNLLNHPDVELTPKKQEQRSMLRAINRYSYKKEKGSMLQVEPDKDDISDHACDALRYYVMQESKEYRLSAEQWCAI